MTGDTPERPRPMNGRVLAHLQSSKTTHENYRSSLRKDGIVHLTHTVLLSFGGLMKLQLRAHAAVGKIVTPSLVARLVGSERSVPRCFYLLGAIFPSGRGGWCGKGSGRGCTGRCAQGGSCGGKGDPSGGVFVKGATQMGKAGGVVAVR